MGLFSNIFGSKKKEQKADTSPYLASKKDPKELHFARVFTEKGGKFIFSENVEQTRNYFHQRRHEYPYEKTKKRRRCP